MKMYTWQQECLKAWEEKTKSGDKLTAALIRQGFSIKQIKIL